MGDILQGGEQMNTDTKEPLRAVCPTCREVIAESKYNYKTQQRHWYTVENVCCDESLETLAKTSMNEVIVTSNNKESDKPSLKDEANTGEIEPSFYSWEINR